MSDWALANGEFRHLQLKDRVYAHLRQAIINGEYKVGAALREVDISTALGVSKTPVREAFVRLQQDRFVELIPYRGAVVAGYSRDGIRELYEIRELIEGGCAAKAAVSANGELFAALKQNVEASRTAVEAEATEELIALFEEFDRLIHAQSNNEWMSDIIRDIEGHQERIGRLSVDIPGRVEQSLAEHEEICRAILRQDPAEAEKRMRAHVTSVMNDQLKNFAEG